MDVFDPHYERFAEACRGLAIDLPEDFRPRLAQFHALLVKTNAELNLTRITDPGAFLFKHALDSLALLPLLSKPFHSLCDVGSGCGAPGVILALARPIKRCALVERTRKKAAFLRELTVTLGLHAEVAALNAMEYRPSKGFDLVTARAVGELARAASDSVHLLSPGGVLAMYQGPSMDEAAAAGIAKAIGCALPRAERFDLPEVGQRGMLLFSNSNR